MAADCLLFLASISLCKENPRLDIDIFHNSAKIFCYYASFFRISAIYNDFHCIYELFYPLFFTFL